MDIPVSRPVNLNDRVALVTGAGGGIGKVICKALVREGARVVASDLEEPVFNFKYDKNLVFFKSDVTRESQVKKLVENTVNHFGRIDIFINSAGVVSATPISDLSVEEWDQVLNVNLKGTFLCCKHVLAQMEKQKYGKIICMGSLAGKIGGVATGPHYVASKAGIHGLVKWLARAGAENGILVNCIVPGQVRTAMLDKLNLSSIKIPVGRLGEPEDVAELVVFLSSDASNFITGALINLNGGILMDG